MPRIPDEQIQRLKREVSLVRLCERYNIDLKSKGKNLVGFCPWHKDDTPSFIVTPDKNLWHCMGACAQGGDVFSLVQKAENVSFRRAADILLEISGTLPASQTIKTHTGTTHPILVNPDKSLADRDLMNHVIDFYHRAFLNDPKAMKYLESRHCMHPEAVKRFRIGYANRTLGYRVPATTAGGKHLKTRLKSLGFIRKSGHEHMSGSVVFPIAGIQGQALQMYGRKITRSLRKGTPEHLYLEQPINGIWNLEGIARQKIWILCECIIDALTLWCHGLRHVTCCFGKNTFTSDLWTLLRQTRPTKIIVAFDNDLSGNKAAEKLAPKLAREGANIYRVKVPQGKDINDYVCMLAQKDKNAVPGILQGLFTDAPVMVRADPGSVDLASVVDTTPVSSLAAKEKNNPDPQPDTAVRPKTDSTVTTVKKGEDIDIAIGDRSYRIRGLKKNQTFDVMRVNIRVMSDNAFHTDTLDLYNARHRTAYINTAADELQFKPDILKKDLGRVLLKLEELQDEQIGNALESKPDKKEMTQAERDQALKLLKSPDLLDKILQGFDTYGLVGERTNKITGYLAAVSRKLDKPLAVVIQSSSASGKSTLMEAVLDMVPNEDKVQYSAMTGQSLFYFGDKNLKHKILAIVEEEGVRQASYALKLLQSEGQLTIASTGKDNASGQMVTKEYHVQGPVMILTTTTAIDIDEELLNRCIVLTVDESREQTKAIHKEQRKAETLEGLVKRLDKKDVLNVQRNAQRLLIPLEVINPYADKLTFLDDHTRTRRDHKKYLTLIRTIAFLHQYQREVKVLVHNGRPVQYIEATIKDIAAANELANEVLGRSLDELPPQTRRFLDLISQMVQTACKKQSIDKTDYRFTQRDVRKHTGWSDYQVKSHLRKLVSLEYLLVHHGGRGQRFVYELLYNNEGKYGRRFLMCLIDADELEHSSEYDRNREHETSNREVSGSTRGAIREHGGSVDKIDTIAFKNRTLKEEAVNLPENAYLGAVAVQPHHTSTLAAKGN